ncbi:methyl-accepting chemotaxis protein [Ahrensia marina]|uniref:methyl-accepting chemotaxis protein n=1 Tax=Ahrensia marina TaxID=1514904 RepID=UPI0035D0441E
MNKALSLKQMIFTGFGLVLALLIVLSVISLRGTNTIGHDFTDYRQAARESLLVNEATQTLLSVRLGVMQYRINNSQDFADQVRQGVAALGVLKNELADFMVDDTQAQQISNLSGLLDAYEVGFEQVVAAQTQRNELVPLLNESGREARSVMSELMGEAYNGGNADAAYIAGVVQQHLMLARYYGEKYLLENRPSDQERTLEELNLAAASVQSLEHFTRGSSFAGLLETYRVHADEFQRLFVTITDIIITRNDILSNQLDAIGPQLATGYETALQTVIDTQNTVGPRAAAEVASVSRTTMIIAVVAVLLGAIAAFIIGRLIARSIANVVSRMNHLVQGELDITIEGEDRRDELGDMARALLVFQENAREKVRLEASQEEQARLAEEEKRRSMHVMADAFEADVKGVVSAVSSAAEQMVGLSKMLSEAAGRAGERSTAVAAASEEASTNVETVAAASEQMTNSIAEVSQRIGDTASMTDEAARGAEHTTATVAELSTSAQTIGDVISMISDIAEQTNLLALNATIEAARAGEAGKGFAVVASEVKSLANQTAKATEEISAQITGMQENTNAVVDSIDKIGTMIQDLNGTSSSIAAAVEEQHSATEEIARNTQQAADGTREVSSNITQVSTAVQETGQAAEEVLAASSQLAKEAERLRDNVADFLSNVRAA